MPHLYKPWKHGRPVEHATLLPPRDRRAARDAQWVRLLGIPVLILGIAMVVLGVQIWGVFVAFAGIGMMLLDTSVLLPLSAVLFAVVGLARLAWRAVAALRRHGSRA